MIVTSDAGHCAVTLPLGMFHRLVFWSFQLWTPELALRVQFSQQAACRAEALCLRG